MPESKAFHGNLRSCALIAFAAVLSAVSWQALTVRYAFGGNWTALFYTGALQRIPADLSPATYLFPGSTGYDGQFYRYVAHDPFFAKGYADSIDAPPFRYRRILVPLAAWGLALGHDEWIDGAYNVVVLLSVFLGVYWVARWAVLHGRSALWGLVFLLLPSAVTSIDRMLVDATLAACFAGFLWYTETENTWAVYLIAAAAFLTRDTGLLLVAAAVIASVMRRQYRVAAFFGSAALPALGWYAFVRFHATGKTPWENISWPLVDIVRRFFIPRHFPDPLVEKTLQMLDVVAIVGLLLSIAAALWIVGGQKKGPVQVCVILFATTGMCFGAPVMGEAYSFGRAISPLLLFVLLHSVNRWRVALVPPLMILLSVGVLSASTAWRILEGMFGLGGHL